jgi:hypothetical protein
VASVEIFEVYKLYTSDVLLKQTAWLLWHVAVDDHDNFTTTDPRVK